MRNGETAPLPSVIMAHIILTPSLPLKTDIVWHLKRVSYSNDKRQSGLAIYIRVLQGRLVPALQNRLDWKASPAWWDFYQNRRSLGRHVASGSSSGPPSPGRPTDRDLCFGP